MKKVAGVDQDGQGDLTEVRRCSNRRQAEQYALVLAAMGIQSLIVPEGKFTALYVALEDAARANEELTAYDSENRERPPGRVWPRPPLPRVEVAMLYWTVLLFFFAAGRHEAFSFDWISAGAAQTGLMLGGEWWRAIAGTEAEAPRPRDYYHVEDEAGRRYFLYREGLYGAGRAPAWFMHGLGG